MEEKRIKEEILVHLPARMREEILRLGSVRRNFWQTLSEIRLRAGARSSLVVGGVNIPLATSVDFSEAAQIVKRISHSSLYAYRDSINDGYIPMGGGVRVGVCGTAKYEGGVRVGVSEISTLVFRIPSGFCDTGVELFEAFCKNPFGMLIYSAPGGGKTTALRALARSLGGARGMRVVVVDERCEFDASDYKNTTVDIMRGYRRAEGVEIATRTLSAEVIIVDEIGTPEEAKSLLPLVGAGVPVIASLHASSLQEALGRRMMQPLYEVEVFRIFVGIFRTGNRYFAKITDKEGRAC